MENCECCKKFGDDIWDYNELEGEESKAHPQQEQKMSSEFIPMEFIQVLIHQHAKTLVALKTLKSEVRTLKPHSHNNHTPSNNNHTPSHSYKPHPLIIDSGLFSQKSTPPQSDSELYSLLSQIEQKISKIKKPRKHEKLGYLDKLFKNEDFDFGKFGKIDGKIVGAVLKCEDLGELRRQVLFLQGKVGALEQSTSQTATPPNNTKPLPQKSLSLTSTPSSQKSLIPVPIARTKKKQNNQNNNNVVVSNNNNNNNRFLWQSRWFS